MLWIAWFGERIDQKNILKFFYPPPRVKIFQNNSGHFVSCHLHNSSGMCLHLAWTNVVHFCCSSWDLVLHSKSGPLFPHCPVKIAIFRGLGGGLLYIKYPKEKKSLSQFQNVLHWNSMFLSTPATLSYIAIDWFLQGSKSMWNPLQMIVALCFHLLDNSCKSLIVCISLWRWLPNLFLGRSPKVRKIRTQFLVTLWHCQI